MEERRRRPWHPFHQPGLCGLRGTMCVLIIITLVFVVPFIWEEAQKMKKLNYPNATNTSISVLHVRSLRNPLRDLANRHETNNLIESMTQRNKWLKDAKYTARTHTTDNCIVCSKGKTEMFIWPIPFNSSECIDDPGDRPGRRQAGQNRGVLLHM